MRGKLVPRLGEGWRISVTDTPKRLWPRTAYVRIVRYAGVTAHTPRFHTHVSVEVFRVLAVTVNFGFLPTSRVGPISRCSAGW